MKFILAGILFSISSLATATSCEQHTPYGVPTTPERTREICRYSMAIKYYDACKAPLYVAEYLDPRKISGNEPRERFRVDSSLPEAVRSTAGDYYKSGYDRGHMAPAANFRSDEQAMEESFLMSNVTPQIPTVNRGVWKAIETRGRSLASKHGGVHIFTGAVYGSDPKLIGSGVCVPTHLYKVIISKTAEQGVAYLVPNVDAVTRNINDYQVPISSVEKFSGINFTPDKLTWKDKIGKDMKTPR